MLTLLCAVFSSAWGQETKLASGTFNGKDGEYTAGWTTTGTGKGRTDCIVLYVGENITAPTLNLSSYDKVRIDIKARRYGNLNKVDDTNKAIIDASISGSSVGTTEALGTNASTELAPIEFTPTSTMTAATLVFTCPNANGETGGGAGINTITITGIKLSSVATPVFSVEEGVYTEAKSVEITCATEGASIYYTTDGSDPTSSSTAYTGAITISKTTTLKAIAILDGVSSLIAEATYNIETPVSITDARAVTVGQVAFTKGIVTSIYNRTAYIQDDDAAICIYDNTNITANVGDELLVKGTVKDQNGLIELINPTKLEVLSSNNSVTPEVMTIAEVNASTNQGWLIKIEEATVTAISSKDVTIAQGDNSILVRFNNTSDITFAVNDMITLTGNIGCYNTLQIANPRDIVVQENTEPTITVDPSVFNIDCNGGSNEMTLTLDNFAEEPESYEVQFYTAEGETTTNPDWVSVNTENMTFSVEANEGEARSAYFKVYADDIYSNLITINQEGYVAPDESEWVLTNFADLTSDDVFVIVGNNGNNYAMSNDGGASSAPSAVEVTLSSDKKKITSTVADNIKWNISGDATNGYIFYPNGETEKWLYSTSSNNGIRVGTGNAKLFSLSKEGYLTVTVNDAPRYVGIYNSTDWRSYTSINSNITGQTFSFYKKSNENTDVPTIIVDPTGINYDADGGSGTITVTYENFGDTEIEADIVFYDEADEETTYDWVTATINSDNNVAYTIAANTGEARTAYLKVFAMDGNGDNVYSEMITINQEESVQINEGDWVLTDLADLAPGDVFVIVGDNGSTYAMSNDGGASSAPSAVEVTLSSNKQKITSTVTDNIKWNISGNADDGYTFYPDGETEKWLYTINSNNGVRVGVNETNNLFIIQDDYLFNTATSRYVGIYNSQDWRCYTSINSNIEDQTFAFYKKIIEPEEIVVSFNKRAEGFSTLYCGDKNLAIPEGVNAYTYKVGEDGRYVETAYKNIIPAGSAVVLELADKDVFTGNYYDVTFTTIAATEKAHADNMLNGFDEAGHETIGPDPDKDYYFYSLSLNANSDTGSIGFYWKNADGSAFTMPANRAYLAVEKDLAGAPAFTFDGFGTNIRGINEQSATAEGVYTISGVRINGDRLSKGVYIVNGKKVVIK